VAKDPLAAAKEAAVAEAEGYRYTFLEAAARASGSTGLRKTEKEWVAEIEQLFAAIATDIRNATDASVIQNLVSRAEELERLRAYVYPAHEIGPQARTSIADMRDWGVPSDILRVLDYELLPMATSRRRSIHERRAGLHKIFDFYDAWENQVSEYSEWVERQARILLGLLLFAVAGTSLAIGLGLGAAAFILGGAVGTMTSVLSRLPRMLGWGDWIAASTRMYGRIGLGFAGVLAGGGLLAAGVVSIVKTGDEFEELLSIDHVATTSEALYLSAIGIVLGFTERMLGKLAGAIVGDAPPAEVGRSRAPASPPGDEGEDDDDDDGDSNSNSDSDEKPKPPQPPPPATRPTDEDAPPP
jgi:hypothetical protein